MSAGPDDRDEGFLTRWSRRKRELAGGDTDSKVDTGTTGPLPPACGGEGLGMGGRKADLDTSSNMVPSGTAPHPDPPHRKRGEGEETPAQGEPEVEPPSLDLIDKDFDLAHWLKQNVPESWKLAALRRAWLADPTIRNFENPARDYALDWNTPGGAPGYGPLTESDDVEAMVRGIFGETPESQPESELADPAETSGDSMPHQLSSREPGGISDVASQQTCEISDAGSPLRLSEQGTETPNQGNNVAKSPQEALAASQNSPEPKMPSMRIRKRRGGAIPV